MNPITVILRSSSLFHILVHISWISMLLVADLTQAIPTISPPALFPQKPALRDPSSPSARISVSHAYLKEPIDFAKTPRKTEPADGATIQRKLDNMVQEGVFDGQEDQKRESRERQQNVNYKPTDSQRIDNLITSNNNRQKSSSSIFLSGDLNLFHTGHYHKRRKLGAVNREDAASALRNSKLQTTGSSLPNNISAPSPLITFTSTTPQTTLSNQWPETTTITFPALTPSSLSLGNPDSQKIISDNSIITYKISYSEDNDKNDKSNYAINTQRLKSPTITNNNTRQLLSATSTPTSLKLSIDPKSPYRLSKSALEGHQSFQNDDIIDIKIGHHITQPPARHYNSLFHPFLPSFLADRLVEMIKHGRGATNNNSHAKRSKRSLRRKWTYPTQRIAYASNNAVSKQYRQQEQQSHPYDTIHKVLDGQDGLSISTTSLPNYLAPTPSALVGSAEIAPDQDGSKETPLQIDSLDYHSLQKYLFDQHSRNGGNNKPTQWPNSININNENNNVNYIQKRARTTTPISNDLPLPYDQQTNHFNNDNTHREYNKDRSIALSIKHLRNINRYDNMVNSVNNDNDDDSNLKPLQEFIKNQKRKVCDEDAGQFKCPSLDSRGFVVCIAYTHMCDGTPHCPLGEDEDGTSCFHQKANMYQLNKFLELAADM